MAIWNKINGVWREVFSTHVNIAGTWRDADVYNNVNGVWRTSHRHQIQVSDIAGFRLIYTPEREVTHPLFPHLRHNENIPVDFYVTGGNITYERNPENGELIYDSTGNPVVIYHDLPPMNYVTKGVVFHYRRRGYEEGIKLYTGILYTVLNNGVILATSMSNNYSVNNADIRYPHNFPDMIESWGSNRMEHLSVKIYGYTWHHEHLGYVNGWNSMFDSVPHWEHFPHEHFMNNDTKFIYADDVNPAVYPLTILPTPVRKPTYLPKSYIGITRNMTKPDNCMIGSEGVMDHTYEAITVNGVSKPFTAEIYYN